MQATYILQKVKYCFYNMQIPSVHSAILNSVLTRFIQLDTNTKKKKITAKTELIQLEN